ncbi:MAG: hypothetical protein ABIS28_10640 [Caldimonas sp.]
MSSQFAKVMVPPVVDAPRGAQWAAAVAVWIGRLASGRRGAGASATAGGAKPASAQSVERLIAKGAA